MASQVTLTYVGDDGQLVTASNNAADAVEKVGKSANSAGDDLNDAQKQSADLGTRMGDLGSTVTGLTDAFDAVGAATQAAADAQDFARAKAERLERAQIDVEQAMIDGEQAAVDLRQAQIDLTQAQNDAVQAALDVGQAEIDKKQAVLDAAAAQEEYNEAVKKYGEGSAEAQQAALDLTQAEQDLKQAGADLTQANIDAQQSEADKTQALTDSKQATLDAREAQVNLNTAMHEADPPELQEWADVLAVVTPLLSGVVGILGLVTAAQWAWNAAMALSPLTWIVIAIGAVIAVIVVIEAKTGWFSERWKKAWEGTRAVLRAVGTWFTEVFWGRYVRGSFDSIMKKARSVWDWFGDLPGRFRKAFSSIGDAIRNPFVSAFNAVVGAWNNTIGRISWTIPGWVPGIGGQTIAAPKFHSGGPVGGVPGSEVVAILQAGERVVPASSGVGQQGGGFVVVRGDAVIDELTRMIASRVAASGGRAAQLGVRFI